MTTPSKHYSGHRKAAAEDDSGTVGMEMNLEKEMWMAGFIYSWRKIEAAAQDRAEWS